MKIGCVGTGRENLSMLGESIADLSVRFSMRGRGVERSAGPADETLTRGCKLACLAI